MSKPIHISYSVDETRETVIFLEGMDNGVLRFSDVNILRSLASIDRSYINLTVEQAHQKLKEEVSLSPHTDTSSVSIIMQGGSDDNGHYDSDIKILPDGSVKRGPAPSINEAIVNRAGSLGKKGDIHILNGKNSRMAAEYREGTSVDIENDHYYYLLDAAIDSVLDPRKRESVWLKVAEAVRNGARFSFYTIDFKVLAFLKLFQHFFNIVGEILIDGNSAEISSKLNRKGALYPTLDNPEGQSDFGQLGLTGLPTNKGITVPLDSDVNVNTSNIEKAVTILKDKGVSKVCLKHSNSTDGMGIKAGVDISDIGTIMKFVEDAVKNKQSEIVIEANVDIVKLSGVLTAPALQTIPEEYHNMEVAISTHVVDGNVTKIFTLQILNGTEWGGNITLGDIDDLDRTLLTLGGSDFFQSKLRDLLNALKNLPEGLIAGGFDCLVYESDEQPNLVVTDPNIRGTGAIFALMLRAQMEKIGYKEAATLTIKPVKEKTYEDILKFITNLDQPQYKLISYSSGWGMIGAGGNNSLEAFHSVLDLRDVLIKHSLIIP